MTMDFEINDFRPFSGLFVKNLVLIFALLS